MSGIPDYPLEETIDFKFTTRTSAGAPITFAGSPAVEVYEDNSLTQITTAETLTVDFDGVTGLHNLRIVCTAANGFEAGKSYSAVVSSGTVDGTSVVGEVLLNFSIERASLADSAIAAAKIATDAITAAKIAADAIGASELATDAANEIADALLDRTNGIETSYTLRQALRIVLAAAGGKLSGAATTNVKIRDVGDSKDRIDATVDANGNRSAVTLDAT